MIANTTEEIKRPFVMRGTGGVELRIDAASALDALAGIYEVLRPAQMASTRTLGGRIRGMCSVRHNGELISFNYTIEPMEITTTHLHPIEQYPALIANSDRQLADVDLRVIELRREQSVIDARLQQEIAQDSSLTNDTKRRAALTERRAGGRYAEIEKEIELLSVQKSEHAIERSCLLREFEVAKLQYERETALIKATAA